MRISDWSSDVCSSDLPRKLAAQPHEAETALDHTLQRGRYFADCERLGVVARALARYQPAIAAGHVIIGGRAGHEYPLAGRGRARTCSSMEAGAIPLAGIGCGQALRDRKSTRLNSSH